MTPVEDKSRRTEHSADFLVGKIRRHSVVAHRHYFNWDERGDGERAWRKCDLALREEPEIGAYKVPYGPFEATVPMWSDDPLVFRNARSDGEIHNDVELALLPNCSSIRGKVSGSTVRYTDAFGYGADLVYEVLATGVAKYVEVDPSSPITLFEFVVNLPKGSRVWRQGPDSGYEIRPDAPKILDSAKYTEIQTAQGSAYFRPFTWSGGVDGEGGALPVEIENVGVDEWQITKSIPAGWTRQGRLRMDLTTNSVRGGLKDGNVTRSGANWADSRDGVGTAASVGSATIQSTSLNTAVFRNWQVFTNTVPAGCTIYAARSILYVNTRYTAAPKTVWVGPGTWTGAVQLVVGDYHNYGATELSDRAVIPAATNYVTHTFTAGALTGFSPGSTNAFCMREALKDVDNVDPGATRAGAVFASADEANVNLRPELQLDYSPNTVIASVTVNGSDAVVTFSGEPVADVDHFTVALDAGVAGIQVSPYTEAGIAAGLHYSTVTSYDAAGHADATPAVQYFVVGSLAGIDRGGLNAGGLEIGTRAGGLNVG